MPSGAARRKKAAAKKKKANTTNNHPPTNSQQGSDDHDPKSHDEKGSDSGEVSSPTASQEHNEDQLRQEEEHSVSLSVESVAVADNKLMGESQIGNNGQDFVKDLKKPNEHDVVAAPTEGDSESRDIDIECVESVKESHDHSKSSSDCSSEKQSRLVMKKEESQPTMMEPQRLEEEGEKCNYVKETLLAVDPIVPVVSFSEDVISDPVEKIVTLSEENTKLEQASSADEIGDSSVNDFPSKDNEEKTLPVLVAQGAETSNGGKHCKVSEVPEGSDNQQQMALASLTVQPTSWKCCCGLFDVLFGPNR